MTLLIPELVHAYVDLATQLCAQHGIAYRAYMGYRTAPEQAQLHANWLAGTGGKAAPAWQSAHQWGLAIDVQPYNPGPTWDDGAYLPLWQALAAHPTLRSGSEFGDGPHIELRHPVGAWSAARLAALPRVGASDLVGRAWPLVRQLCHLEAQPDGN
jgi:hypothetical protein